MSRPSTSLENPGPECTLQWWPRTLAALRSASSNTLSSCWDQHLSPLNPCSPGSHCVALASLDLDPKMRLPLNSQGPTPASQGTGL